MSLEFREYFTCQKCGFRRHYDDLTISDDECDICVRNRAMCIDECLEWLSDIKLTCQSKAKFSKMDSTVAIYTSVVDKLSDISEIFEAIKHLEERKIL